MKRLRDFRRGGGGRVYCGNRAVKAAAGAVTDGNAVLPGQPGSLSAPGQTGAAGGMLCGKTRGSPSRVLAGGI